MNQGSLCLAIDRDASNIGNRRVVLDLMLQRAMLTARIIDRPESAAIWQWKTKDCYLLGFKGYSVCFPRCEITNPLCVVLETNFGEPRRGLALLGVTLAGRQS